MRAVERLPAAGGEAGRGEHHRKPDRPGAAALPEVQATTLTIRRGTMITFFGDLPSSTLFTASSARTAASISALLALRATVTSARFLAVDLYRQRQRILDQKVALDRGPGGFRDQRVVAEHGPAFLGEVRHHRRKQLHKNINRFVHGPAHVGGREGSPRCLTPPNPMSPIAARQRIGELVDRRHTNIKVQLFDVIGDLRQGLMGRLAQRQCRRREGFAGRSAGADAAISAASPTSRHSLCRSARRPARRARSIPRRARAANPTA